MQLLALVVTYNPDNKVFKNLYNHSQFFEKILVIDNSDKLENQNLLLNEQKNLKKVKVIFNKENLGLAKALNMGIDWAISNNFNWILTLDQDSFFKNNPLPIFLKTLKSPLFKKNKTAIISSVFQDTKTLNLTTINTNFDQKITKIKLTLSSGNFLNLDVIQKYQLKFNEKYFIYHLDNEFNLNLKKLGLEIIENKDLILNHQEGNQTKHNFWFKKNIITTNHSPIARYYITRNLFFLNINYLFKLPKLVFTINKSYLISFFKMVFFEKNKLTKLKFTFKGILDGLMNKGYKLQ